MVRSIYIFLFCFVFAEGLTGFSSQHPYPSTLLDHFQLQFWGVQHPLLVSGGTCIHMEYMYRYVGIHT